MHKSIGGGGGVNSLSENWVCDDKTFKKECHELTNSEVLDWPPHLLLKEEGHPFKPYEMQCWSIHNICHGYSRIGSGKAAYQSG